MEKQHDRTQLEVTEVTATTNTGGITMNKKELIAASYRELQKMAKERGIRANQTKDILIDAIENYVEKQPQTEEDPVVKAFLNGEPTVNTEDVSVESVLAVENANDDEFDQLIADEDDFFDDVYTSASEASAPADVNDQTPPPADEDASDASGHDNVIADKTFTFVRANNLGVVFMQKGVEVKIGWNPNDAKTYIKTDDDMKNISIQTAIDRFKPFKNGVHGDIAQIVKALVRIKKMPAPIVIAKQKRMQQQRAERAASQPQTQKSARYSGTVDAGWLAEFRQQFEESTDRQPTGLEILAAWTSRTA